MLWVTSGLGILFGVFTSVINCLALATVAKFRSLWVPSSIYLSSMMVSDLTAGLALTILCFVTGLRADYDQLTACVVLRMTLAAATLATVLTSVLVSVDRFVCISQPYFYERVVSNRKMVVTVLTAWAVTAVVMVVMGIMRPGSSPCGIGQSSSELIACLFFWVSSLVCGVMYALTSRVALRHQRAIASQQVAAWAPHIPWRETSLQKLRGMKMFVVVFGVFFVFWFPSMAAMTMAVAGKTVPLLIKRSLFILGHFNSFCNVFIYLSLNHNFKVAFISMFKRTRRADSS